MPAFVEVKETGDMLAALDRIEIRMRRPALRKAGRAAGEVVKARARQIVKRSRETGTRDGWSQQTRDDRQGAKELADTLAVVARDYGDKQVIVVGPQYPAGALGHLVEDGHELVAWGKETGKRVPAFPFMEPAADETESQQVAAIVETLKAEGDAALRA